MKALASQITTEEIPARFAQSRHHPDRGGGGRAHRHYNIKISEISTAVASAIEQQDAATREMAHYLTTIAQSTSLVSEKVAGLANAAGETGQSAHTVRDHAGELKHQADAPRIDQFLTRVRAA